MDDLSALKEVVSCAAEHEQVHNARIKIDNGEEADLSILQEAVEGAMSFQSLGENL